MNKFEELDNRVDSAWGDIPFKGKIKNLIHQEIERAEKNEARKLVEKILQVHKTFENQEWVSINIIKGALLDMLKPDHKPILNSELDQSLKELSEEK